MLDVVIVGAGFSGLYMLHKCRELGLSAKVYEAGDDVGGTWYWNRYPGARCDVESIEYSYSFSPELQQAWDWNERYAAQPDILAYIKHATERFDLRCDIQFNTRISSARFDEAEGIWHLKTELGETLSTRFFIAATGCLSAPLKPQFEGLGSYRGETYYTSLWPHEAVDFSAKRVAVIGTGSSGVQAIPLIAEQAAQLDVYQRTPCYVVPAFNREVSEEERRGLKARYDEVRRQEKESFGGIGGAYEMNTMPLLDMTEEQRNRVLEDAWARGGNVFSFSFMDVFVSEEANRMVGDFIRKKTAERINDPELAAKLMPRGRVWEKRLIMDTGYYETFNRDNVDLVDVRETPIERLTTSGIETTAGEREYDAIVFATGFDALTGALTRINIRGREGASLKEKWQQSADAYLGLMVAGFPNLFTLAAGPRNPAVFTNVVQTIEANVSWVADCLAYMQDGGIKVIEAALAAERGWVSHANEVAAATIVARGNSWYAGANVPGKKREFLPYLGGLNVYRQHCVEVAENGYPGFIFH